MIQLLEEQYQKIAAASVALIAVTGYALWDKAGFPDYASAVEWILGLYLTGKAATQIAQTRVSAIAGAITSAVEKKTP